MSESHAETRRIAERFAKNEDSFERSHHAWAPHSRDAARLARAYLDLLTEQDALREAMVHVLEWPLPDGTVETWALPKWLAQEARAALPTPKQQEDERER